MTELLKSKSHFEVLRRGFAILKDKDGGLVSNVESLKVGSLIAVVTNSGEIEADVTKIIRK